MDDAKKLLQDILDAVVSEDAGGGAPFMYIWKSDWIPLKERIMELLNKSLCT